MGRKDKRVAARQLTSAMKWIEPPIAIGGKNVLIHTKTITAGRLGGILRNEHRQDITSELKYLSILSLPHTQTFLVRPLVQEKEL
jgi:hypothetical protein